MSYRVEITLSGLCLLVCDTHPTLGEVIHVLMPDAGAMMTHFPRLVYSRDYELPATATAAPPMKTPSAKKIVQNNEQVVELVGFPVVDLKTALDGGINAQGRQAFPPEILNVSDLAKGAGAADPAHRVAKTGFRADPLPTSGACVARITIPSTKLVAYNTTRQLVLPKPGGTGTVATSSPVAACVTATYDVDDENTGVATLKFNVGSKAIELKPSAGVIKLLVGNMIEGDYNHPPAPQPAGMMAHFSAYYDLLVTPLPNNKRPSPQLPGGGTIPPGGVNPITCMLGGGCGEADTTC
jgi:hypothetical protein